ncbi:amidohydrolase, partial [Rhizobium brockwellii]
SMPSGSVPVRPTDVDYFRNRHLLSGTTTLLNVCGLALPDEIDGPSNQRHAMDIHLTTAHTTSNLAAAIVIDGGGLSERHKFARIDDMVDKG